MPPPKAEPLLLAACLHLVGRGQGGDWEIRSTLGRLEKLQEQLRPVRSPSKRHKRHVIPYATRVRHCAVKMSLNEWDFYPFMPCA